MKNQQQEIEKIIYIMGLIIIACIFLGALIIILFELNIFSLLPPCYLYSNYGYYCPGCGGTRAFVSLMQGHVIKSFLYHPVVPYMTILGTIYMLTHTAAMLSAGKRKGLKFRPLYAYLFLFLILLNFVIKNLPILLP